MRPMLAVLAVVSLFSAVVDGGPGPTPTQGVPPQAAFVQLLAQLDAAASALDVDRFLSYFVAGPDMAYTFNGMVLTKLSEVRDLHVASWSKLKSAKFRTGTPRVAMLAPRVAVLTAVGRSERTYTTGESKSGEYALTLVLIKKREGWRIVQGHESVPCG